jgi:hypothetical protein
MNSSLSAIISVVADEGCPIRYGVEGSSQANFLYGGNEPSLQTFELSMHSEVLREFLVIGTEALAEMDAIYAKEEPANDPRNG